MTLATRDWRGGPYETHDPTVLEKNTEDQKIPDLWYQNRAKLSQICANPSSSRIPVDFGHHSAPPSQPTPSWHT